MKLYIIAGEASGDLHASNLIRSLKQQRSDLEVRGWGGELMQEQGATIAKHYKDLAFMGFIEVVMNLRTILGNIRFCKEDILEYKPDAVVLVDYPGFNLRIATFCREQGIPVLYYISPQAWAWKENRVKRIKRDVTRMFCILPFEKAFYEKHGMDVDFVGHPLLDVISADDSSSDLRRELGFDPDQKIIALLPGSRKQEINTMLPVMLKVAEKYPDHRFVIAGAPGQEASFYKSVPGTEKVKIVFGKTYQLFAEAEAGLITSGTATLEAALNDLPQVVCYKGSSISYYIARMLVKIKYISLVNLIMDQEVVRELIQHEMNEHQIHEELNALLSDSEKRQQQLSAYEALRQRLGGKGASERTAKAMLEVIASSNTRG